MMDRQKNSLMEQSLFLRLDESLEDETLEEVKDEVERPTCLNSMI